jgi:hypothetical protein
VSGRRRTLISVFAAVPKKKYKSHEVIEFDYAAALRLLCFVPRDAIVHHPTA